MKKRTKIILCVIASIVLLGTIFGVVDYSRIKNGNKPLFMVKQYDKNGVEINYYGLGYKASGTLTYSDAYRIESVRFGLWFYTWNINACEKCIKDEYENISDYTELNDVYYKVGMYFGDENLDRSNLAAYTLDTENNVVIVELIDNSKEKQESFFKNAKVDSKYSKYIKFEQGGPYTASDKCNSDGLQIITGEINEINNPNYKRENSKGTILINFISGLDSEDDIVFYHNSNIEFKIGQKVRVGHNGNIDLSNPPQAFAECIELIQ